MRFAEIYVNTSLRDDEIYANQDIEREPRETGVVRRAGTDHGGESEEQEEEYLNVDEFSRTTSQRSPSNDGDQQQIYENVAARKPTPAPKPKPKPKPRF